jgi:hypothetical protein
MAAITGGDATRYVWRSRRQPARASLRSALVAPSAPEGGAQRSLSGRRWSRSPYRVASPLVMAASSAQHSQADCSVVPTRRTRRLDSARASQSSATQSCSKIGAARRPRGARLYPQATRHQGDRLRKWRIARGSRPIPNADSFGIAVPGRYPQVPASTRERPGTRRSMIRHRGAFEPAAERAPRAPTQPPRHLVRVPKSQHVSAANPFWPLARQADLTSGRY